MYIYTYIYKYICSDVMKKIQCAHLLITTMALWQAMEGQYIYIYRYRYIHIYIGFNQDFPETLPAAGNFSRGNLAKSNKGTSKI